MHFPQKQASKVEGHAWGTLLLPGPLVDEMQRSGQALENHFSVNSLNNHTSFLLIFT